MFLVKNARHNGEFGTGANSLSYLSKPFYFISYVLVLPLPLQVS